MQRSLLFVLLSILFCSILHAQANKTTVYPLTSTKDLEAYGVEMSTATFKGKKAVRLVPNNNGNPQSTIAKIVPADFKNGVIEVSLASLVGENAPEGSRGFAGIAFRMHDDFEHYECFYIRPTNGRADDQIRRNHATQYVSHPDYPWYRLRKENPGVYESYVDLEVGVWTTLKIEVLGEKARFYVNNSSQPVLIVNDLKHGADQRGGIALWIGSGTEAYFSDLKVTPSE